MTSTTAEQPKTAEEQLAALRAALVPPRQEQPQTPTVGRIVHFHEAGGPYAAIVAAVNPDGSLELATIGRNSLYFQHGIHEAADLASPAPAGTWTWPPRAGASS